MRSALPHTLLSGNYW